MSIEEEIKKNITKTAILDARRVALQIAGSDRMQQLTIVETTRKSSVAGRSIHGEKIELNMRLITTPDQLRDVLYHELAHAVCFHCYGTSVHHGREWKEVMKKLGREPRRTHNIDLAAAMPDRWTKVFCDKCEKVIQISIKKAAHLDDQRCRKCYGTVRKIE